MKILAIVQARMGSSRLPGKVLKNIKGKSVLRHVVERLRQSKKIDEVVVATTLKDEDKLIINECKSMDVSYYAGSENDVLERYYMAAVKFKGDVIIRVTSDCPLIDPKIVDELIDLYIDKNPSIATNAGLELKKRTFPRGLDAEIFSKEKLEDAYLGATLSYQREHVTPYIYETNEDSVFVMQNKEDYSKYRWTLDTEEDFILISEIYEELYRGKHNFYTDEIIELMERRKELYEINKNIIQKKYNEN